MDRAGANWQQLQQAQLALDTQSLDGLRQRGLRNEQGALREAAQQFESIFMGMLLKSMRDANAVFEQDNPLHSRYGGMYRDMYDQQLSAELSRTGSLGLSDLIVQQLGGAEGFTPASLLRNDGDLVSARAQAKQQFEQHAATQSEPLVTPPVSDTGGVPAGYYYGSQRVNQAHTAEGTQRFESPQEFVDTLMPYARKVAEKTGLSALVMVAQAALETGWGKRIIPGEKGGSSNNLFNIKADTRWQGDKSHISTLEYDGQVAKREKAAFRAYDSIADSFHDYAEFLQQQPRYQQALAVAADPQQFAQALQQAGYATDPAYANKLQRLMQSQWLQNTVNDGVTDRVNDSAVKGL
ncbi:flagellar assembly peptidoglycan hydrolase FlgJ [Idiomarina xiamenensis]|uniref:Peptidoglycan hydrolase FlgJ n=1 Tax=Idiomarina xiamenensis 10-D-4 TaxID=740709 RepID=K2K345_9GAMM|nr:flagellar assembly peptidoglycan hydrolase FlgJ [Idiomarina xiamenensis]EKE82053.1 flagellum-specific muramidase [Idiomarina xiamenensis 10-D-4]